jgi:hypothetical protein
MFSLGQLPAYEVVGASPFVDLRSAASAIKTACAGLMFLQGRVKRLAMGAGKINGKFGHFHPPIMAGGQADA